MDYLVEILAFLSISYTTIIGLWNKSATLRQMAAERKERDEVVDGVKKIYDEELVKANDTIKMLITERIEDLEKRIEFTIDELEIQELRAKIESLIEKRG